MPHTSHAATAAGLQQAYSTIASHPAASALNPAHTPRVNSISYPRRAPSKGGGPQGGAHYHHEAPSALSAAPGLHVGSPRKASADATVLEDPSSTLSSEGHTANTIARHPSNSYNATSTAAPYPKRTPSSSSYLPNSNHNLSSGAPPKSPVEVKHGKLPGQIWMPEGIVDMASFGPILAMDESDPSREFSKALVWAWCDQAEMAIEEMEHYLSSGEIARLADKAHYLKGSSASLGLLQVSATCQSIYHTHFPPSLAHLRSFSYTGGGNSGLSTVTGRHSSSSASSASSANTTSTESPCTSEGLSPSSSLHSPLLGLAKPSLSPGEAPLGFSQGQEFPFHSYASQDTTPLSAGLAPAQVSSSWNPTRSAGGMFIGLAGDDTIADLEKQKLFRAQALLEDLKGNVKTGSEWLYAYYRESDKYAGL